MDELNKQIEALKQNVAVQAASIISKDQTIDQKSNLIAQREDQIQKLEAEIKRLQEMILKGGHESSELGKLLTATQKQLFEADERINKLMAEVNAGKDL